MEKILDIINSNVSRGKKTLIFTQSNELARAFLYDNPGKWKFSSNSKYWPDFEKRKNIRVTEGAQVGFDRMANDVIFTKRPCLQPHASWTIVQCHFISPVVQFEDNIERRMDGSVLFVDDAVKYYNIFDVISGPDMVIREQVGYIDEPRDVVVAKRFCDPFDLCALHNATNVYVPKSILWEQMPTIHQCQSVMEAMSMARSVCGVDSSVDADWISRHAIVNAFAIPRTLELLEAMRCVEPINVDCSTVVIQKKPPCPASIEFGKIPEGTFHLAKLRNLLGKDVLKLLKSYEGNGLVFGFNQQMHTYYKPVRGADRERYHDAVGVLTDQTQRWKQVEGNGKWLNNALHENVRRMYNSHEVYMTSEDMKEVERINDVMSVAL